jgi:hypothetical protein
MQRIIQDLGFDPSKTKVRYDIKEYGDPDQGTHRKELIAIIITQIEEDKSRPKIDLNLSLGPIQP